MLERLQKFMSSAGACSRRRCEQLILEGRVTVNGVLVRELGTKVDPEKDEVAVDGRILRKPEAYTYLVLNKPAGYLSTVRDEHGRPTVMDLVREAGIVAGEEARIGPGREAGIPEVKPSRLYPVGRLDLDTEGLLLLTDDGELANRLLHPRYGVKKSYRARVLGRLSQEHVRRLESGVELEDGTTAPAEVRVIRAGKDWTEIEITIHEGRKRQVKRMLKALGHPVKHLTRVKFGPLSLGSVPLGRLRRLTGAELQRLRRSVNLVGTGR